MGYVRVKAKISHIQRKARSAQVDFIVDTGAMWTMVPRTVLESLGVKPNQEGRFRLANGQAEVFPLGDIRIEIEGNSRATTVIFGPENAPALLGVTTLEQLGLEVDPVTGKLKPMELLLL